MTYQQMLGVKTYNERIERAKNKLTKRRKKKWGITGKNKGKQSKAALEAKRPPSSRACKTSEREEPPRSRLRSPLPLPPAAARRSTAASSSLRSKAGAPCARTPARPAHAACGPAAPSSPPVRPDLGGARPLGFPAAPQLLLLLRLFHLWPILLIPFLCETSLRVAVWSMGNTVYGQLGNPRSDVKSEVFTWGKGANGRLGHGDIDDRKIPTLVEALRDRAVRHISCDSSAINKRKDTVPRLSGESNSDTKLAKAIIPSNLDMIRSLDSKAAKQGKKTDALSFLRSPQMSSLLQLRDIALSGGPDMNRPVPRAARTPATRSVNTSRAVSPFSRRPSPPRSTTPVPTTHGLSIAKSATDNLTKKNEMLNQEVERLRGQVDSLRHRCEVQELELQKSAKKVQEAMAMVAEESAKSKAAKEVIKALTAQLKDMAERLPPDDGSDAKQSQFPNGIESHASIYSSMDSVHQSRNESLNALNMPSLNTGRSLHPNGISSQQRSPDVSGNNEVSAHRHRVSSPHDGALSNRRAHSSSDELFASSRRAADSASMDTMSLQNGEDGYKSREGTLQPKTVRRASSGELVEREPRQGLRAVWREELRASVVGRVDPVSSVT
ncbi:hypothetical protein ZWY2020_026327 [Hordeum vulgare]|nr:hypothetical protein ZWY2020_026327 [Hordeum vulgare]